MLIFEQVVISLIVFGSYIRQFAVILTRLVDIGLTQFVDVGEIQKQDAVSDIYPELYFHR